MPIVDMKKIFLFSHQQEKDTVINILRDIGVVELVDIKESNEWEEMKSLLVPEWSADAVSFYESLLGRSGIAWIFTKAFSPAKELCTTICRGENKPDTCSVRRLYFRKREIKAVYQSCRKMDEKLTNLRNEETRCHNLLQSLAPWAGFSLPLEKVENTLRIQMQLFTVATDELPSLQKSLTEISPDHYLEVVSSDKELTYFLLISLSEEAGVVREALKESGATEISFPGIAGTAAQAISMLKEKLENIQHERAELLKKVEDLINYRPHLMAYYDFLEDERDKKEAINKLAGTKTSFMLEG